MLSHFSRLIQHSKTKNKQVNEFIDRITLTYGAQNYYFNTFNQIEIKSDDDDGILSNLNNIDDLEQGLDIISEYNECNNQCNEYI